MRREGSWKGVFWSCTLLPALILGVGCTPLEMGLASAGLAGGYMAYNRETPEGGAPEAPLPGDPMSIWWYAGLGVGSLVAWAKLKGGSDAGQTSR